MDSKTDKFKRVDLEYEMLDDWIKGEVAEAMQAVEGLRTYNRNPKAFVLGLQCTEDWAVIARGEFFAVMCIPREGAMFFRMIGSDKGMDDCKRIAYTCAAVMAALEPEGGNADVQEAATVQFFLNAFKEETAELRAYIPPLKLLDSMNDKGKFTGAGLVAVGETVLNLAGYSNRREALKILSSEILATWQTHPRATSSKRATA